MGRSSKSIYLLSVIFFAPQALAGQQANQSPASSQPSPTRPMLRFFNSDLQSYSWDQVFYGPMPRPGKMSSLERRARHTSDMLERGLGFAVFEDKTFGEILEEFFAGQHGLEIVVDWDALAACSANVTPDSRINLDLGHVTVEELLDALLEQLSEQAQVDEDFLTYYVLDGKVKVSTRGEFNKLMVTRIYNISFVGRGKPHFVDAPELGLNRRIPYDLAEPPPDPNLPPQAGTSRNPRRNFQELRDELIRLLKEFRPDSWKAHGGKGTISIMGNDLLIRQTCEMHELIGGKWW